MADKKVPKIWYAVEIDIRLFVALAIFLAIMIFSCFVGPVGVLTAYFNKQAMIQRAEGRKAAIEIVGNPENYFRDCHE